MIAIKVAILVLTAQLAFAQVEGPGRPEYLATSRLVTLRVVPMDRQAKLFFAGQKAVQIDFEKDHKVLEITAFKPKTSEALEFTKQGEAYVISNLPNWKEPYDLVVKSETKGKVENIRVHIKNQKP